MKHDWEPYPDSETIRRPGHVDDWAEGCKVGGFVCDECTK